MKYILRDESGQTVGEDRVLEMARVQASRLADAIPHSRAGGFIEIVECPMYGAERVVMVINGFPFHSEAPR